MNLQPTLENDLVIVRPLKAEDYKALFLAASDPLIWEQHTTTDRWLPEGFKKYFEESLASGGCVVIKEKSSNIIIGSSRYHYHDAAPDAIEIGWSFLSRDYWGGLYNRAFKSLMIAYGLEHKVDVLFLIAFDNLRSQRATEKLGGQLVDPLLEPHLCRKKDSHNTYRINASLWETHCVNLF